MTSETPHIRIVRKAPQGLTSDRAGRLGILGGSYNPITLAHLALADAVIEHMHLQEVIFCLSEVPPHKSIFGASLEQRLDIMQLAVSDRPYATVGLCTHGLFIDIYRAVKQVYPVQAEVFFLTGRDAAERILTWSYEDTEAALREMFTAFQLIVFDREGHFDIPDDPRLIPYHDRIHRCAVALHADQVSSTAVRDRLQHGQSIDALVPPTVADYIQEHGLYAKA
jgi:nicotinate-nucleotide adenylyltransferase